jgi:hypothetical protein
VPDYVRDWIEVARRSGKSGLRKDRLVKQMKKMQRKWKEMGVDPSQYPQDDVLPRSGGRYEAGR